ncbi:VOC family protein [Bradyrhizobium sp. SHOUNA76]|nr:VOC family protein [Bradyrhizobium sp. SHOUNA76]MCJ9700059.1 VOC family protein [Bradyrhizobium sp. SHOUNA76]MCJ9729091.1 VOC family protein [Bradyrhizobium sp. PRIMUS42]
MLVQGLGQLRQLGYVVRDIHAAMDHWTRRLGVGPFFYFERAPVLDFHYRNEPSRAAASGAFSNLGAVQIELIQPLDDHPSVFNDFLNSGLEGLQHFAFWTQEFDACVERFAAQGAAIVQQGYTGNRNGRFAYFETEAHPGTMIEISEVQDKKAELFERVAEASRRWDGSDPVRSLSTP